jgi:hypothetical protein
MIFRISGTRADGAPVEYAVNLPDRAAAEAWAADRKLGAPRIERTAGEVLEAGPWPASAPARAGPVPAEGGTGTAAERVCRTPGCGYRGPGEPVEWVQSLGCLVSVLSVVMVVLSIFSPTSASPSTVDATSDAARCPKCRKWLKG